MSKTKKEIKKEQTYFEKLNLIDVSKKVETKGKDTKLSYLSWAYAWGELKKAYPTATYKVYEREDGTIYWTDGRTGWVKTSVTVNDIEHIDYLPIMDFRNQSIAANSIKSTEVNKTIQRSITKAIARHGLGLYIYAGEDLPEDSGDSANKPSLANIAEGAGNDMADLVEKEKQTKIARKGMAEAYFMKTKEDIELCGSIEEIEALLEKECASIGKLENGYKAIYNKLMESVEGMKLLIDPNKEHA